MPLHREFLRSWCTDTSRLDPEAGVEPAEPLNGGSLGIRATLTSVSDHSPFSRCLEQGRRGHCGCRSPKGGCGVGDSKRNVFLAFSLDVMRI